MNSRIDIRCGDYRQVLADVTCDAVIVDAPYSAKTHSGHDESAHGHADLLSQRTSKSGKVYAPTENHMRPITYAAWSSADVAEFCDFWRDRCTGWIISVTDHVLAPVWMAELERTGRYVFAPLPWVAPGSRVRLSGDGPSSWTCWIIVARPKSRKFASWGTLPGAYIINADREGHIGGKPVKLMRELIDDYSRPGDTICDPCMGFGTTGAACIMEGRNFIGAELDPDTFAHAQVRLDPMNHKRIKDSKNTLDTPLFGDVP